MCANDFFALALGAGCLLEEVQREKAQSAIEKKSKASEHHQKKIGGLLGLENASLLPPNAIFMLGRLSPRYMTHRVLSAAQRSLLVVSHPEQPLSFHESPSFKWPVILRFSELHSFLLSLLSDFFLTFSITPLSFWPK